MLHPSTLQRQPGARRQLSAVLQRGDHSSAAEQLASTRMPECNDVWEWRTEEIPVFMIWLSPETWPRC